MSLVLGVTWAAGEAEDSERVILRSGFPPRLVAWIAGHSYWTLDPHINARHVGALLDPVMYAPTIRHELTHVHQQRLCRPQPTARRRGNLIFLWRYYLKGGRAAYEAEAHAAEQVAEQQAGVRVFPEFRIVTS